MERQGHLIDGEHNTKEILSTNDFMVSTTVPVPGTAQEFTEAIYDTVINGEGQSCS